MQAKPQRGFSNIKQKNSSRPNSSNPLNHISNQPNSANNRPLTAKALYQNQNQPEKVHFQLKINPLNYNNNFRPTRPASSATDRVFNKYWVSNTPRAADLQTISRFDITSPKGENLITNELLVDFNKKQKTIYNRSLYKYNKIDWETKKTSNFLNTVGGLEIQTDTCILNTPIQNYENFSINSTAIASRPQSNTVFGNSANNFFNAKNPIGFKNSRPLTGYPIKSKNNNLRLNSAKNENQNYDSKERNIVNNYYSENAEEFVNGFNNGDDFGRNVANNHSIKRPLTGNVNKRAGALRPFSATSNKIKYEKFYKLNF